MSASVWTQQAASAWPAGPGRCADLMLRITDAHRSSVLRLVRHRFRARADVPDEMIEDAVQTAAARLYLRDDVANDLRALWITAACNVVRDVLKSPHVRRRAQGDVTAPDRIGRDPQELPAAERDLYRTMATQAAERFAADTPLGRLIRSEFADDVRAFMCEMDPTSQLVFRRHDIEGRDYLDISRETGLSVAACKMRLHRARAALRDWLDEIRPDILTTELAA